MLKAIILGGTIPHKELIRKLKVRGYYTILVDYLDNPPASTVSDEHIKESCLDKYVVLELAVKFKVDLVISACIDQALVVACYVSEKLNLPHPISYATSLEVTNKALMKEKMLANGVETSNYTILEKYDAPIDKNLTFPLVVKPVDANSSKGVKKVLNNKQLKEAINQAFLISRDKKVIVEEFVVGVEIGVDCFISNTDVDIIMLHQKRKPLNFNDQVMYSIGSISPPLLSDLALHNIKLVVKQIAKIFNLKNTPLLIQFIVSRDFVSVIEFSPRIGGGLNYSKILKYTNFDILNSAIDSFLNNQVTPRYTTPNFYFSENHVFAKKSVYGHTTGYEELVESGVIEEIHFNKNKGDEISDELVSSNRIFSFIVKGKSIDEIKLKIRKVLDTVKVFDKDGVSVLFYELYNDLYL